MELFVARSMFRRFPGKVMRHITKPRPKVVERLGARDRVGDICSEEGFKRVFVVTDETLYSLGFHKKIVDSLEKQGIEYYVFHGVNGEPSIKSIEEGRNAAIQFEADSVVALGGGSVMDTCKIIAASAKLRAPGMWYFKLKFVYVPGGCLPIIGIPSTAGTGAEVTVASMITNPEKNYKVSAVLLGLKVPYVILDSELTMNSPAKVTAGCGLDALSHGLEAVISDMDTDEQYVDEAMECVRLVLKYLPKVLEDPNDNEARLKMARAALYGGYSINSRLVSNQHAFAHALGARYHIPHGHAIAVTTIPVTAYEAPYCLPQLKKLAVYCSVANPTDNERKATKKLLKAIKELIDLCEFDDISGFIKPEDYEQIANAVIFDSINYCPPVALKRSTIYKILDRVNE